MGKLPCGSVCVGLKDAYNVPLMIVKLIPHKTFEEENQQNGKQYTNGSIQENRV